MLLKYMQTLHERPSCGIAHSKNHESVQNMRQFKASNLTLVYCLSSLVDSGGSFRKQFMSF